MTPDIEETIREMRIVSDQIDQAYGTSDYQTLLISLALIARELLRRWPEDETPEQP